MAHYTRREFTKLALTALPAVGMFSSLNSLRAADVAKQPNSKVAGVQIGLNVPYSFGDPSMDGDEVIRRCVALGVSAVELRTQPVEAFLGSPVPASVRARGSSVSPAEAKAIAEKVEQWRLGVSMDRVAVFQKKFADAGVLIEIMKVDGIFKMSDPVLDYAFAMAKMLGARAISTEISHDEAELKRMAVFAEKHRMMVGLHGHATTTAAHFEHNFSLGKYSAANLDIGHFVAGGNGSPVEFIKKHHDRITHVHIKDRKVNNGINMPFGEGDTPIKEVLRLIRDNRWNIQATIEFEYKVPANSDRMTEIGRAVQYCRDALA